MGLKAKQQRNTLKYKTIWRKCREKRPYSSPEFAVLFNQEKSHRAYYTQMNFANLYVDLSIGHMEWFEWIVQNPCHFWYNSHHHNPTTAPANFDQQKIGHFDLKMPPSSANFIMVEVYT